MKSIGNQVKWGTRAASSRVSRGAGAWAALASLIIGVALVLLLGFVLASVAAGGQQDYTTAAAVPRDLGASHVNPVACGQPDDSCPKGSDFEEGARIAEAGLESLLLSFVPNRGQMDEAVAFAARTASQTFWFTRDEVVFDRTSADGSAREVVRLRFVGAEGNGRWTGVGELPGRTNYFLGSDPENWVTDVPNYAGLRYNDLYPGIAVVYRGGHGGLKCNFVVGPGADPGQILLAYTGAEGIAVNEGGELVLKTPLGELVDGAPRAYQEVAGIRREVEAAYELSYDGKVGFLLGDFDASLPLVVDPFIRWSGFLGGTNSSDGDHGVRIDFDTSGNVYIAGRVGSTDYPTQSGYDTSHNGGFDVQVSKLSADGATLMYSTFLGGDEDEIANGMVVVGTTAYIAGHTDSNGLGPGYPTTLGAYDTSYNGAVDAFVSIIDTSLSGSSSLLYSTFFGGNEVEGLLDFAPGTVRAMYYDIDIAVDGDGNVYIAGRTQSNQWGEPFPVTVGAYDTTYNGVWDGFFSVIDPSGNGSSDLLYSTYFGGSDDEWVHEIALDTSNNAYIVGSTESSTGEGFPTTLNAYDTSYNGDWDAFVAVIDPGGNGSSDLLYSTYFGGTDHDRASGVDVDSDGNVYMAGPTESSEGEGFPTTAGAYDTSYNGNIDAFVAKISPSGNGSTDLLYSTYLGGTADEACVDSIYTYEWIFDWSKIELGCSNMVYLHVPTESTDFPTTTGAYSDTFAGTDDATIVKMNLGGNGSADLLYSTYVGGDGTDHLGSIAVSDDEDVGITVGTESRDYPTTSGVYQEDYNEPADENVGITVANFRDWGDAPDSYGTYESADGPRHILGPMRLGTGWDAESDGNPGTPANGDDTADDWPDDEDGVTFAGSSTSPAGPWSLPYQAGQYGAITATVTGPGNGWLAGWFDWDQSSAFDSDEREVWRSVVAGTYLVTFTANSDTGGGDIYVRFRLAPNSTDISDPTSGSSVCGGEVEDYVTLGNPTAIELASFTARSGRVLPIPLALSSPLAMVALIAMAALPTGALLLGRCEVRETVRRAIETVVGRSPNAASRYVLKARQQMEEE
ncbi:MAG: SBBP repeat-containing protein [Anaerolineae bacterium]